MIQKTRVLITLLLFNMSNNTANNSIHNTFTLLLCKNKIYSQEQLRMFKIRKIDISVFHCVTCSQLLLLCFPEVVSMNAFLNNQIDIP